MLHSWVFALFFLPFFTHAASERVWVLLNNHYKGRIVMDIANNVPCLRQPLVEEWGIHPDEITKMDWDTTGCLNSRTMEQKNIRYFYDDKAKIVTLLLPEALLSANQNGISTSRWDDGINAAFINYHLNYATHSGKRYHYNTHSGSGFVDISSGVNLGAWRLRYQPSLWQDNFGHHGYYTRHAWAMRDIRQLRGHLQLGDADSPSTLFDSISFRGAMLATDDGMLPDNWRNFSPLIKGVAHSHAEVTLRQAGVIIYQTLVLPGPFELKEVYPPAAAGDLEMTIKESDGSETLRILPYASMPNLTQKGHYSYQLLAGKYRPYRNSQLAEPSFGQAALTFGLADGVSLYGGFLRADFYQSYALGIGKNLRQWGAISLDATHSQATDPRRSSGDRGDMYRLRFAKAFFNAETSLSLQIRYFPAGQRFRTFSEAIRQQQIEWWDVDDEGNFTGDAEAERRLRWELYFNQNLWDNASLYLTAVQQRYRQKGGLETLFQAGYFDTLNDIDYGLSLSHNRFPGEPAELAINYSISIPFSLFSPQRFRSVKLNDDRTMTKNGTNLRTISASGTALEDYSLRYQIGATRSSREGDTLNGSLGYEYNAGKINLGAAKGTTVRQFNADMTGSILVHRDGMVLGQELGETMALVELPQTAGVGVDNQFGVTTDKRGFALVSYLTPYRVNYLSLDDYSLPEGFTLPQREAEVVPTRGAVAFARFLPPEEEEIPLNTP